MLRTLSLALVLAFGSASAQTNPVERSESMDLAVELLALMDMDKMFDGMQGQLEAMMQEQISTVSECEALRPAIERFSKEMGDQVIGMLKADAFLADIAQVYVEVFTVDELEGLLDFYRSPLGQKMLDKMPELMQKSMEISQRQTAEMIPRMEAAMERFTVEVGEAKSDCEAVID